jgi:hypothetical protein
MPATVIVSPGEADLLNDCEHLFENEVPNIDGYALTYNPGDTVDLLSRLDKDHEMYPQLSERLAAVASQLGIPDVMFKKPSLIAPPEAVIPEPMPAKPDEAPRSKQPVVDLEKAFEPSSEEDKTDA